MSKVGLFVDIEDQFFRVNKKWPDRKLNYEAYYQKAKEFGEVTRAIAYGTEIGENSNNFISCLHHIGFEPRFKFVEKGEWFNWAVGITVDIIRLIDNFDIVVIGATCRDLTPLVKYLKETQVKTIIFSCGVNRELKLASDEAYEITEDMLEAKISITEEVEK